MSITAEFFIVGAGGFGREVYHWLQESIATQPNVTFGGFIDDNQSALNATSYPYSVRYSLTDYTPKDSHQLIMAIANPQTKKSVATQLKAKNATFAQLIHPTVKILPNVTIGEGAVICPYVIIANDTTLGNFVTINSHTTIGHDVKIGTGCTINGHCDITGNTTLGQNVFMGSRSGTIPGITIADSVTVGAGSTVMKNTRIPNQTIVGTPAKKLL